MRRVFHVLAQRPSLTGSGVTLAELVREGAARGYEQRVLAGVPADDADVSLPGLPAEHLHTVRFGRPPLGFPVPGMSDVMPYPSSVYSRMSAEQIARYRDAMQTALSQVIEDFEPDLVHSHHVWLTSSWIKDVAPSTPVVVHCHATGLRQLGQCPHLADEVGRGNARNDAFVVLHRGHRESLCDLLAVAPERVHVVGSGYAERLFCVDPRVSRQPEHMLYAGKFSRAKGVPWFLEAAEQLSRARPGFHLHVAGGADEDEESRRLAARMDRAPWITRHGRLDQGELAALMQRCGVFVLPSLYEGVPLVVIEAAATGAEVVVTALPGVLDQLAGPLQACLQLVPAPHLVSADEPDPGSVPAFVESLRECGSRALDRSIARTTHLDPRVGAALAEFTWAAVFGRVENVWNQQLSAR